MNASVPAVVAERPRGAREIAIVERGGGGMMLPQSFGEIVAFAGMMAKAQHAIPKHLRGNEGACMAVTMQALRWEMDPFAVAAKTYCVNDLVAYEAQLFAAVVNTRAPIKGRPRYDYSGEGANLRCTVTVAMKDGSEATYTSPSIGTIKVKNSPLWTADPAQQLGYYSIRAWARRYAPEVILGVYSPDELDAAPTIGPDRAREVNPAPRRIVASPLDDDPPATSTAMVEDRRPEGHSFDALGKEDSAEHTDPHAALIDRLRSDVMDGKRVAALLQALPPAEREMVSEDDRKSLLAAQKTIDAQSAGAPR